MYILIFYILSMLTVWLCEPTTCLLLITVYLCQRGMITVINLWQDRDKVATLYLSVIWPYNHFHLYDGAYSITNVYKLDDRTTCMSVKLHISVVHI